MSIAKFFVFPAVFAVLLACGEVKGDSDYKPGSSSSQSCTEENCLSSNSDANSSSSFDIGLDWVPAPKNSYVHGATSIKLDAFDISKNLITQSQYMAVMGGPNPSKGEQKDTLPIEGVNWFKAVEFCKKLSILMNLDPDAVKLPTEAEWEYVAFAHVIQRNADYWEWTNDCWDEHFPYDTNNPSGPPNCLPNWEKVRKGVTNNIEDRYATNPSSEDISMGFISFRVVLKKKFLD